MNLTYRITTLIVSLMAAITAFGDNILSLRDTITDPAMVFAESLDADMHRLRHDWYMERFVAIDRPVDGDQDIPATDEELIARLQAMPTVIEMPFNSLVKRYIETYTRSRRGLVENMLALSLYYMPIFEEALELEGLPLELKYLPIIESALDPNAVSRRGATGLWQFMPGTAKDVGLEINSLVDERRDPRRSSQAAARYLHQLYDTFGDWSLAIAAYNCGGGTVQRALLRTGENRAGKDYWDIYYFLPTETRGYVPGYIAAAYTMNYYDKHNISAALARQPILTDTVHVNRHITLQQISEVLDIPIDQLRLLNPQYRKDIIPGEQHPYVLTLPSHQVHSYVLSEDSIANHSTGKIVRRGVVEPSTGTVTITQDGDYNVITETKIHTVVKGETLEKIAKKYGVKVDDIRKANKNLGKKLKIGQAINIVTTRRELRPVEESLPSDMPDLEEATEEAEPAETIDAVDTVEEAESAETIDAVDTVEEAETVEVAEPVEVAETVEVAEPAEETEPVEVAEPAEVVAEPAAEVVEHSEVSEAIESQVINALTPEPAKAESTKTETKKPEPKKADNPVYHKVEKGETLEKIAKRYGISLKKIQQLNPNVNPKRLRIGQKVRVK